MSTQLNLTDRAKFDRSDRDLDAWLSPDDEEIIDPAMPIVDAHHHLWVRPGVRYLMDELLRDVGCGHNVEATVFMEGTSMYRKDGPVQMRCVSETEFAAAVATLSESGAYGDTHLCAGIVSLADLELGDAVQPVLDAHRVAGGGRFCGVRHRAAYDDTVNWRPQTTFPGVLLSPAFRQGYARLAPMGLVFDAWLFWTQIDDLIDLADAFPQTTIVLNHCGGLLGVGRFEGQLQAILPEWRGQIARLAQRPNVVCKLGGMGMVITGFDFAARPAKTSSTELAGAWKPIFDHCIEHFGAERCIAQSNFPPDRQTCSYRTLWNAFKRALAPYSAADRAAIFHGTARRIYGLSPARDHELLGPTASAREAASLGPTSDNHQPRIQ